jgi:hypothetical protein
MAKRPVPAHGQQLAALVLLGVLCACATTPAELPAAAPPAGWRIVERVGEARYAPPGAAAWVSATVGETLADGSEVSTGRGGRLIVHAPGRHLSVGPDSRFVLPDPEREDPLSQRAGWLRYRIAEAQPEPFRIHTRALELELLAGVVDVHVNHLATEVTVKEGQVRVATPDGLRQTQMMAGQSAQAGGAHDLQLAVRPGGPLQPVDRVIVPALHPSSTAAEIPARSAPASTPGADVPALAANEAPAATPGERSARTAPRVLHNPAASDQARPHAAVPVRGHPVGAPSGPGRGAAPAQAAAPGATAPHALAGSGAPERTMQPVEPRPGESGAAALRRSKFERLSAGMLDQVEPRSPAPGTTPGTIR